MSPYDTLLEKSISTSVNLSGLSTKYSMQI
jgi:hypothetical protein